ncbi:MAG: fumarate hydratase [Planctomycetota bacterium]
MRSIELEQVSKTIESLCIAACYELPEDVLQAIQRAAQAESHPGAARILTQLIENAEIAARDRIPLCQDTGLTVVFVEQGAQVTVAASNRSDSVTLVDAINEGVRAGYEKGYLRRSVVADPLGKRPNTGTNTPAVIHHTVVPGDRLEMTVMAKGGGCENKSRFRMFRPTAETDDVTAWIVQVAKEAGADACPPFVVGVGIGGSFELSCLLSKKALLRRLAESNADESYAQIERDLLARINALGVGPQGLGGDTTALAVHIETAPCHIASLPVAVNIECHSHRHKTAIL